MALSAVSTLFRALAAAFVLLVSVVTTQWLMEQRRGVSLPPASLSEMSPMDAGAGSESRSSFPRPDAGLPVAHPLTAALCPQEMAWIQGDFCPGVALRDRGCSVKTRPLAVCMDRHEYPNQIGVLPAVMLTWPEARLACRAEGKRLCADGEWTLACRGTQRLASCNFGRTTEKGRAERLWLPENISREVAAHDGRRVSDESACVSPFAVFDLPGNVQEWVTSENTEHYVAALKGGRYNQSSIDCERSIHVRTPEVRYPHTGFRCCRDPLVVAPEQSRPRLAP